jgi:hypothetical protein
VDGKIEREYVGSGPAAELTALLDDWERTVRQERTELWRLEREEEEVADEPLRELCDLAEAAARGALVAHGYHRHERGEWRKRRKGNEVVSVEPAQLAEAEEQIRGWMATVSQAENGDASAMAEVRSLFGGAPSFWARFEARYANLPGRVERILLQQIFGSNLVSAEATRRKLAEMKAEFAGPDPSPLDQLMAERVVACYLAVMRAEMACEEALLRLPVEQAAYYEQRVDRASKRLFQAVRTYAAVRKAELPAIQLNIAREQVNLAG